MPPSPVPRCTQRPCKRKKTDECRDANLQFVEQPALQPPEFVINQADQQRFQQEIEAAAAVPLPDEDDDL